MDVRDWDPPDGKAVVYEVETDCSPAREREKVAQYMNWIVRDVIVLDPMVAPERVDELWQWLDRFVIG